MAKKKAKAARPATVGGALVRIQREGRRLAGRVERDLGHLLRSTRAELSGDVRALQREVAIRVREAARDLDGRAGEIRRQLEKRFAAVEGAVWSRLSAAARGDAVDVKRQLGSMDRRLVALEKRLDEFADTLRDQLAVERG